MHFSELNEEAKEEFGQPPEGYFRYWASRFPRLLVYTWNVMKTRKEIITLKAGKLTIEKHAPIGRHRNPDIVDFKGHFEKISVAVRRIQKSKWKVSISHHKEFDRHENIARYYVTGEDDDY